MDYGKALISVIVPVYNVEKYLETCISSIIQQTYRNIEIILVDDGSTDTSGAICEKIKNDDERIKVFHKANGGLSDARNCGISVANGEYLVFIDSDDVVDKDYIEYLYELVNHKANIIGVSDLLHCFPNTEIQFLDETNRVELSKNDAIEQMLYQKTFLVAACGKIFPASCFSKIQFPKGLLYEDAAIMYLLFENSSGVVYGNAKKYGYMHRENSITTKKFNNRDLDIIRISEDIYNHYKNVKNLHRAAKAYYVNANMRVYIGASNSDEDYKEVVKSCERVIRRNLLSCFFDLKIRNKLRISLLIFCFSRRLLVYAHSKVDRWK